MVFGMQPARLVFNYGSVSKNQSLGKQTVFRNPLTESLILIFASKYLKKHNRLKKRTASRGILVMFFFSK